MADTGRTVVIKRRRQQAYVLTPIHDNDIVFSHEALRRIDEFIEQIKRGECVKYTPELEQQLFDNYV
jgi:hypothetical protein